MSAALLLAPTVAVTGYGKPAKRSQILQMQRVLFSKCLDESLEPTQLAACARAWDVLENRMRILKGELAPGSINARDDSRAKHAGNKPKVKRMARGPVAGPTSQAESVPPLEASPKESLSQADPSPHPAPGGGQAAGDAVA